MTEVGKKFVDKVWSAFTEGKVESEITFNAYDEAQLFLSAFCDEVEKRAWKFAAEQPGHDPNFVDKSDAFDELKLELLDPDSPTACKRI